MVAAVLGQNTASPAEMCGGVQQSEGGPTAFGRGQGGRETESEDTQQWGV